MKCTSFKHAFKHIQQVQQVYIRRGKDSKRANYWKERLERLKTAPNLKVLAITASDLEDSQILEPIANFAQLRELYLWGNHFESIPSSFVQLQNLRVLSWCRNQFTQADQEILKQLPLLERLVYHPQPSWFSHPRYYYLYSSQKTRSHFKSLDTFLGLVKNERLHVKKTVYFSDLNVQNLHIEFTIAEAKEAWISMEELEEQKLEQFIKSFAGWITSYQLKDDSIVFQLKKEYKTAKIYSFHLHLPQLREEWAEEYLKNYLDNRFDLNLGYIQPELEEESTEGLKALLTSKDIDNVRLGLDLIQVQGALPSLWNSLIYLSMHHQNQDIRMLAQAVKKRVIPEPIYQQLCACSVYKNSYERQQNILLKSTAKVEVKNLLGDAILFGDSTSVYRLVVVHQAALFPEFYEPQSLCIDHDLYEGIGLFFNNIAVYQKLYTEQAFQGLSLHNFSKTCLFWDLAVFPKLSLFRLINGRALELRYQANTTEKAPRYLRYIDASYNALRNVSHILLKNLDYLDLSHNRLTLSWVAKVIDDLLSIGEVNLLDNPTQGFSKRLCFHLAQYPDLNLELLPNRSDLEEKYILKLSLNHCICRFHIDSKEIYQKLLKTIECYQTTRYKTLEKETEEQVSTNPLVEGDSLPSQFSISQAHRLIAHCCLPNTVLHEIELFYELLLYTPLALRQDFVQFFVERNQDYAQFCQLITQHPALDLESIEAIIAYYKSNQKELCLRERLDLCTHIWHSHLSRHPQEAINIEKINIQDECIGEFPQWLFKLPNIKLIQCFIPLEKLPLGIATFQQLNSLTVYFDQITPPQSIIHQFFEELNTLSLSILRIKGLELDHYLKHKTLVLPKSLYQLSLINCSLREIPESIFGLVNLFQLDLNHNYLLELPERIWDLQKLSVLHLEHNQLTRLPLELFELKTLFSVSLDGNQVAELEYPFEAIPKYPTSYQYEICTEDYFVEYYTTELSQYIRRIDFKLSHKVHKQVLKMAENGKVFLYPKHYSSPHYIEEDHSARAGLKRPLLDNIEQEMDHLLSRKHPIPKSSNKSIVFKNIDQQIYKKIQEYLQTLSLSKAEDIYKVFSNKSQEAYLTWLLQQSQGQRFSILKQVWHFCNWMEYQAVFLTNKKENWRQQYIEKYRLRLEELRRQINREFPRFKQLLGFNTLRQLLQVQGKVVETWMELFQREKRFRQRIFKYDYALWVECIQLTGLAYTEKAFQTESFRYKHSLHYLFLIPKDKMDAVVTKYQQLRPLLSTEKPKQIYDWFNVKLRVDRASWYILFLPISCLDVNEASFFSFQVFPHQERAQVQSIPGQAEWTTRFMKMVIQKRALLLHKTVQNAK
ncbi:MAG: leucine-rich repeat domain-containing protein [Saprospiraceae bacterium]|nr:leucine-rich repeat domain-containing protein [Saprospiraceae bacterium]